MSLPTLAVQTGDEGEHTPALWFTILRDGVPVSGRRGFATEAELQAALGPDLVALVPRVEARSAPSSGDFSDYSRRALLDYIRRNDANGYATLEGDESMNDLRDACRSISQP